jgi:hypothetical protein
MRRLLVVGILGGGLWCSTASALTTKFSELPPLTSKPSPPASSTPSDLLNLEVAAGGAYGWLLSDSLFAGCGAARLTQEGPRFVLGWGLSTCVGRTLIGLVTAPLALGFGFDGIVKPWLRLGLSLTGGALMLRRSTTGTLAYGSIGLYGEAKFDIYRADKGRTLFLFVKGGGEILPTAVSFMPLLITGIGLRMTLRGSGSPR